jgi:hypothetical protein
VNPAVRVVRQAVPAAVVKAAWSTGQRPCNENCRLRNNDQSRREENTDGRDNQTGTVLIKDGTLLPDALRFESEPCATGWGLVKNLDGYGVGRKIHEAGWTFLCVAGEIKETIFGFDGQKTARRAVKRILTNLKSEKFNGLEITQVEVKRFWGLPYATVCAHSRHIKENAFLLRVKDHQDWDRARLEPV